MFTMHHLPSLGTRCVCIAELSGIPFTSEDCSRIHNWTWIPQNDVLELTQLVFVYPLSHLRRDFARDGLQGRQHRALTEALTTRARLYIVQAIPKRK